MATAAAKVPVRPMPAAQCASTEPSDCCRNSATALAVLQNSNRIYIGHIAIADRKRNMHPWRLALRHERVYSGASPRLPVLPRGIRLLRDAEPLDCRRESRPKARSAPASNVGTGPPWPEGRFCGTAHPDARHEHEHCPEPRLSFSRDSARDVSVIVMKTSEILLNAALRAATVPGESAGDWDAASGPRCHARHSRHPEMSKGERAAAHIKGLPGGQRFVQSCGIHSDLLLRDANTGGLRGAFLRQADRHSKRSVKPY